MNLMEQARWSDMFFNYVPAEQASVRWYEETEEIALSQGLSFIELHPSALGAAAKDFKDVHQNCPMSAMELAVDFCERA